MLAAERHQYILHQLAKHQSIKVVDIVEAIHCSQATIRRDLDILEQQHQLKRVHGGAILPTLSQDSLLKERLKHGETGKIQLAKYVSQHFLNGRQCIFLDAGSSTHQLIPFLNAKKHHVVTNGAHHLERLVKYNISTTLIGGKLKQRTQAIVGSMAVQQIQHYHFDSAILGVNSIDNTFGLSTPDSEEAFIKQMAIQQARQSIVLAEYAKFDTQSFHQFATIQQVEIVTVDCPVMYRHFNQVHCLNKWHTK
ncbi:MULTISPECIES: DeoR/GlpR family DNA-binding transcription regulator [unclassified Granulicatella]|uniref:DeoR/GlpR family DNA-binding transcription regulator n=1 Tax=unclassified Granulicatella TaxID=2630493 RepID=UPI0010731571|nr:MULTISPECIES: DeoR/GlpR family DNA-binding transcription regulator [unclassified Granulicatella]MBF0779670.1 DeoR/GlpR transcriptional regulator [Granulicatella sp. 19428wC4_WM01]TFU96325.1 DeoR/GlpR transcriptional regulator [Granulicatella sp. WM01]